MRRYQAGIGQRAPLSESSGKDGPVDGDDQRDGNNAENDAEHVADTGLERLIVMQDGKLGYGGSRRRRDAHKGYLQNGNE